jgi:hypothetical protein
MNITKSIYTASDERWIFQCWQQRDVAPSTAGLDNMVFPGKSAVNIQWYGFNGWKYVHVQTVGRITLSDITLCITVTNTSTSYSIIKYLLSRMYTLCSFTETLESPGIIQWPDSILGMHECKFFATGRQLPSYRMDMDKGHCCLGVTTDRR